MYKLKDLNLFGEEEKKVPTIDELTKQFEDFKKEKDAEIAKLQEDLDKEKAKNAQYVLAGMTKKVETPAEEEEIEFVFGE